MKNLKFSVHPLFIVLGLIQVFCGNAIIFAVYLATILLHELGHFAVSKSLGYRLESFVLLPQGAQIYGKQQFFSYNDEIKIALAGPLVNVIITVVLVASWWIFPISYASTEIFAFCNIITALFNILPILPLDGGRVFVAIFSKFHKRKLGIKISNIIGLVISGTFLIMFIISLFNVINFTFLVIPVFLLVGIFCPSKRNTYQLAFSQSAKKATLKKGMKVRSFVIDQNTTISKLIPLLSGQNFNIIYVANEFLEIIAVLHESDVQKALETHRLDARIKEIM